MTISFGSRGARLTGTGPDVFCVMSLNISPLGSRSRVLHWNSKSYLRVATPSFRFGKRTKNKEQKQFIARAGRHSIIITLEFTRGAGCIGATHHSLFQQQKKRIVSFIGMTRCFSCLLLPRSRGNTNPWWKTFTVSLTSRSYSPGNSPKSPAVSWQHRCKPCGIIDSVCHSLRIQSVSNGTGKRERIRVYSGGEPLRLL